MNYQLLGMNHKTAPVEVRELLAIPERKLPEALRQLLTVPGVSEGLILSTCNRIEILAQTKNGSTNLRDFLTQYFRLEPQAYEELRVSVDAKRRATEGLIEQLKTTIRGKLAEAPVPVMEIDGRIKRLWSIHQKLKRQKIELDQVYDFIAVRIVTDSIKDCYAGLIDISADPARVNHQFRIWMRREASRLW